MKSNTWKRFASPVEDFTIQMFPAVRNMTTVQRNVRQWIQFDKRIALQNVWQIFDYWMQLWFIGKRIMWIMRSGIWWFWYITTTCAKLSHMTNELKPILDCNAPEKKNVCGSTQGQIKPCVIYNTSSFFSSAYTTKYVLNISENLENGCTWHRATGERWDNAGPLCKKELKYHAVRIVSMISIALISMLILFLDF